MKKRGIAVFLIVLLLCHSLSACGGNTPSGGKEDIPGDAESAEIKSDVLSDAAGAEAPAKETEEIDEAAEDSLNEAYKGCSADLSFDGMENDIWTGYITLPDGSEKELVIPVMTDGSGSLILSDYYRRIVCVYEPEDEKGELRPVTLDASAPDTESLLRYASFIEIYDILSQAGWSGEYKEAELSDIIKEELLTVSLSPGRLLYLSDADKYHIFRFDARAKENGYEEELFSSMSGIFDEMDEGEYALIVNR